MKNRDYQHHQHAELSRKRLLDYFRLGVVSVACISLIALLMLYPQSEQVSDKQQMAGAGTDNACLQYGRLVYVNHDLEQ